MGLVKPFAFLGSSAGLEPDNTNLTFWVDAGLTDSYPGTGTTFTDIAPIGNGWDLTINGSPAHTAGTDGYFTFANTEEMIYNPGVTWEMWDESANEDVTFEFIFSINSYSAGSMFNRWESTSTNQVFEVFMTAGGDLYNSTREAGDFKFMDFQTPYGTNWVHCLVQLEYDAGSGDYLKTFVVNKTNYAGSGNWTNYTAWNTSTAALRIGRNGSGNYWRGNMAVARVYNTKLSAASIEQNYDYFTSRGYNI